MSTPEISICFPVFNEADFIDKLLESVVDSAPLNKEILLIDGGSTDGTREKIKEWAHRKSGIELVENSDRYVPHGFNKAYRQSKAPYISLMGAHASYPPNFFKVALQLLENGEADAVGGPLIQKGRTWKGKVIASCMSEKWGVGGTEFRTSSKRRYVQSVAFAVYKKKIFEKAGLLDEQLIRNQDDEFHYRLNHMGFRILMVPELACTYFVRESLKGLWKQYYGYGLFKPLVLKKVGTAIRSRHIIPALFTIYWILVIPLVFIHWITLIPPAIYLLFNLLFSLRVAGLNLRKLRFAFAVFPTLHLAYGSGFLKGLFKKSSIKKTFINN